MQININGLIISYIRDGMGPDLLLLHGWGMNKESFNALIENLKEDYTVYAIDLPGFGQSTILHPMCLDEYVNVLNLFISKLEIDSPIILGHSFGGRVAIKYSLQYQVKKLILVGTPGIRKKISPFLKIKIVIFKILKALKIKVSMGSKDYQLANNVMKKTLVKVVNEDLGDLLPNILCETLLIWGENDSVVKVKVAKKMNKLIKKSGLIIIPHSGHFPYIDKFRYFLIVLKSFLYSVTE